MATCPSVPRCVKTRSRAQALPVHKLLLWRRQISYSAAAWTSRERHQRQENVRSQELPVPSKGGIIRDCYLLRIKGLGRSPGVCMTPVLTSWTYVTQTHAPQNRKLCRARFTQGSPR